VLDITAIVLETVYQIIKSLDSTRKCNKAGKRKVSCGKISAFQPTRVKGALMSYTQLTQEQRYQISALLKTGCNQSEIAKTIEVHKSTISREVRRNQGQRGYRPKQAHNKAMQRRNKAKQRISKAEWQKIDNRLKEDWSPEQISNKLKQLYDIQVSHEWIYHHIREDKRQGGKLYKHLRRPKKYRKQAGNGDQRGQIPNKTLIEERPEIVERRERIGDWEADTIIGRGHQGAIVTLVDRKSRFLRMGLVKKRTKDSVKETMIRLLSGYPVHTITCDNGKEFAAHEEVVEALSASVYFAHPYASWERGTNENTNGLIRQYIPKGTNFKELSTEDINFIENRLNFRPRKCIDFDLPMVFLKNHCCT
jgi:transposase, IS30 family